MSKHDVINAMSCVDMDANPKLAAAVARWFRRKMHKSIKPDWTKPVYLGLAMGVTPALFVPDTEGRQQRIRFEEMKLP